MQEELKKILELSKKTGDKVIVYNETSPENSFVVMSIDAYEKMVQNNSKSKETESAKNSLTEDEMIDKINSDMDSWEKPAQPESESTSNQSKEDKNWKIPNEVKQEASNL